MSLYNGSMGNVPSMMLFHFMIDVSLDLFGVPQLPLMVATVVAAVLVVLDRRLGWLRRMLLDTCRQAARW